MSKVARRVTFLSHLSGDEDDEALIMDRIVFLSHLSGDEDALMTRIDSVFVSKSPER